MLYIFMSFLKQFSSFNFSQMLVLRTADQGIQDADTHLLDLNTQKVSMKTYRAFMKLGTYRKLWNI